MKKTAVTALALGLAALMMTGCTAAALNAGASASPTPSSGDVAPAGSPSSSISAGIAGSDGSSQYIAQEEAENIALADAGLSADRVQALRSRLEYDDGRAIYDVEFWTGTDEYDYDIDATTGDILSMDYDAENYRSSAAQGDAITEDAARQAALAHAGVADDGTVQFFRCQPDWDDGRHIYEVEFCANGVEYNYELDACTGEVLSYDYDAEYHHHSEHAYGSGNGHGYGASDAAISADEAKNIALQHAGVAEADTTRMEVKLDREDGRLEYDVEWDIGSTDYEYTIDAYTGGVLSFEVDD